MKFIRIFLSVFALTFLYNQDAFSDVSAGCASYTDCDALVACELYTEVENALSGLTPDFNGAVARAVLYRTTCYNYPDLFKKNIDIVLSETPPVRLSIDWSSVKNRMLNGAQNVLSAEDMKVVSIIVDILGPDTMAQQNFFEKLAIAYVAANKSNPTARLDDAFILNFLGDGDNLASYKPALVDLTGDIVNQEYGVDISWDDILIEISEVLDNTLRKHGALVCENNRSWQAGIDIVGWAATAVAAILTFWSGGAGGAAVVAGRAAVGAGLKTAAKGIAKVGGKAAAKSMSKTGSRMLAKSAIDLGMKANMRGYATYAGRGVLKTGIKNYTKAVGANLAKKATKFAVAGALVYQIGGSAANNSTMQTVYGLIESDLTKDIVNCQGLDHNEGCYTVCGDGPGTDDLNTKALKPVLGKSYCVNEADYALYEINNNNTRGKPLLMTKSQWNEIKNIISTSVKDQGKCDYNEDDIDMYVGFYMYDPDTLEISDSNLVIDDIMRLDD